MTLKGDEARFFLSVFADGVKGHGFQELTRPTYLDAAVSRLRSASQAAPQGATDRIEGMDSDAVRGLGLCLWAIKVLNLSLSEVSVIRTRKGRVHFSTTANESFVVSRDGQLTALRAGSSKDSKDVAHRLNGLRIVLRGRTLEYAFRHVDTLLLAERDASSPWGREEMFEMFDRLTEAGRLQGIPPVSVMSRLHWIRMAFVQSYLRQHHLPQRDVKFVEFSEDGVVFLVAGELHYGADFGKHVEEGKAN